MENLLGSLDGVVDAEADFVEGMAIVTYDPARVAPDQMVEAVNTQTLFRASLPNTEETTGSEGAATEAGENKASLPNTEETTGGLNPPLFAAGGVLILLAGVVAWRVVVRRRSDLAGSDSSPLEA